MLHLLTSTYCGGCILQEARELLEKFVVGTVKAGTAKAKQAPVSVTDLAAAAAADPSKPKVLVYVPRIACAPMFFNLFIALGCRLARSTADPQGVQAIGGGEVTAFLALGRWLTKLLTSSLTQLGAQVVTGIFQHTLCRL